MTCGYIGDAPAWQSCGMPANDALLGLLQPAFQVLIAGLLLIITILGLRRLAQRGPARMTNAVVVTGLLIVTFTVVGTLAVSCSGPRDRGANGEKPTPETGSSSR